MSSEKQTNNMPLIVLTVILALVCAAGGWLVFSGWQPEALHELSGEVTNPESSVTIPQTTASSSAEKPALTTVTSAVQKPEPDPHAQYYAYLDDTLLPEAGCADTSAALPCDAQCGIAGVFFDDLRDTGTDDMVVIRLDSTGGSSAAMPVLLWYGCSADSGEVILLDTFEIKPQWSGYTIRRSGNELYLSGEYLNENGDTESWRFTEMQLAFQPEPDLIMMNMDIESAEARPEPYYPESAELLLEMQLDTASPIAPVTERKYILRSYIPVQHSAIGGQS